MGEARPASRRFGSFAAYDLLMTIAPAMILTLVSASVNGLYLVVGLFFPSIVSNAEVGLCLGSFCMTFLSFYVTFFLLAVLTTVSERKNIRVMSKWHLVTNLFTFPVFMLSYVPIALVAAVKKVDYMQAIYSDDTHLYLMGTNNLFKLNFKTNELSSLVNMKEGDDFTSACRRCV